MKASTVVLWVLAVLTLLVWLPAISLTAGILAANAFDCQVHEGFPQPCMAWGRDIGGALYTMTVMGWLMIATLPFMVLTVVAWLALAVSRLRRRKP